jgi:hypothetical protein
MCFNLSLKQKRRNEQCVSESCIIILLIPVKFKCCRLKGENPSYYQRNHKLYLKIITSFSSFHRQLCDDENLVKPNKFLLYCSNAMKSRTKQQSSAPVATTSTKNLSTAVTAGGAVACDSHGKHYPSISAAYWLPAPNTTPYLLPG